MSGTPEIHHTDGFIDYALDDMVYQEAEWIIRQEVEATMQHGTSQIITPLC